MFFASSSVARSTPYEQQLQLKQLAMTKILKKITDQTKYNLHNVANKPAWLNQLKSNDKICDLLPIVSMPEEGRDRYRNKFVFTIAKNEHGTKCIGMRLGRFVDGNTMVAGERKYCFFLKKKKSKRS